MMLVVEGVLEAKIYAEKNTHTSPHSLIPNPFLEIYKCKE